MSTNTAGVRLIDMHRDDLVGLIEEVLVRHGLATPPEALIGQWRKPLRGFNQIAKVIGCSRTGFERLRREPEFEGVFFQSVAGGMIQAHRDTLKRALQAYYKRIGKQ